VLSFNEHISTGFDCASGMPARVSAPYKHDTLLDHKYSRCASHAYNQTFGKVDDVRKEANC
jgi:hypothetical protein